MTSRSPSVVTSATGAVLPSSRALVATVVPWASAVRRARRRARRRPSRTARPGSSGVDSTLATVPSAATTSVKVPPVSAPTRMDRTVPACAIIGGWPAVVTQAGTSTTSPRGTRRREPRRVGAPRRRRPRLVGPGRGGQGLEAASRKRKDRRSEERDILAEHFGDDWRTNFLYTGPTRGAARGGAPPRAAGPRRPGSLGLKVARDRQPDLRHAPRRQGSGDGTDRQRARDHQDDEQHGRHHRRHDAEVSQERAGEDPARRNTDRDSEDATWDEIVAAHRHQARVHHPDRLFGPVRARRRPSGEERSPRH